jgi:hypothetical protein
MRTSNNAVREFQARPYLIQGKGCRTNDVNARPVLVPKDQDGWCSSRCPSLIIGVVEFGRMVQTSHHMDK